MKKHVWIIEQYYRYGGWKPLDMNYGELQGHQNFFEAHKIKREFIDSFWDISKREEKENFRIVKYQMT